MKKEVRNKNFWEVLVGAFTKKYNVDEKMPLWRIIIDFFRSQTFSRTCLIASGVFFFITASVASAGVIPLFILASSISAAFVGTAIEVYKFRRKRYIENLHIAISKVLDSLTPSIREQIIKESAAKIIKSKRSSLKSLRHSVTQHLLEQLTPIVISVLTFNIFNIVKGAIFTPIGIYCSYKSRYHYDNRVKDLENEVKIFMENDNIKSKIEITKEPFAKSLIKDIAVVCWPWYHIDYYSGSIIKESLFSKIEDTKKIEQLGQVIGKTIEDKIEKTPKNKTINKHLNHLIKRRLEEFGGNSVDRS